MKQKLIITIAIICSVSLSFAQTETGPVTQRILERGELICGINGTLPGFSLLDEETFDYSGFDVDICKAVAAAILGAADAVTYIEVTSSERPVVFYSEEIDMLSRNTTWTLSRDAEWNATFGPTIFYDGQGVMVRRDTNINTLKGLEGKIICTDTGTTTELNMSDAMASRNLNFTLQTFQTLEDALAAFFGGVCDAVSSDRSALIAQRAVSETPSAYVILDETLSKEPLGPVSPQNDPQFADIVRWTVYGMINAEELGVTSKNVADFMESDSPEIQRLLGIGGTPAGDYLGIPNDFMVAVIQQVGNYGEVYERHLGEGTPYELPRGLNNLWTEGGLLYAPPFR